MLRRLRRSRLEARGLRRPWQGAAKEAFRVEYREVLAIVGMASETNRLVTALGVPIDEAYEMM